MFTAYDIARQSRLSDEELPDLAQVLVNTPGDVGGGVYPEGWGAEGEKIECRVAPDTRAIEREVAFQLNAPSDWRVVMNREHTVPRDRRLSLEVRVKNEVRTFVVAIIGERYNSNPTQTTLLCRGPVV